MADIRLEDLKNEAVGGVAGTVDVIGVIEGLAVLLDLQGELVLDGEDAGKTVGIAVIREINGNGGGHLLYRAP